MPTEPSSALDRGAGWRRRERGDYPRGRWCVVTQTEPEPLGVGLPPPPAPREAGPPRPAAPGGASAARAGRLADQGTPLVYGTPDKQAGIETSYLDRPFIMRELYRAGTSLHPDRRLKRIARNGNRQPMSSKGLSAFQANLALQRNGAIWLTQLHYASASFPALKKFEW